MPLLLVKGFLANLLCLVACFLDRRNQRRTVGIARYRGSLSVKVSLCRRHAGNAQKCLFHMRLAVAAHHTLNL